MNSNIIGLAGRMGCGKTTLSNICVEHGYKRLYFALPLKQMCASILNISIDELNKLKRNNTPINIDITPSIIDLISEKTDIPKEKVDKVIGGKKIKTVRDLLQIVGTNVIRCYNSDWHVNRIKEMIKDDEKYVFDDIRFPNEKKLIESMGGICWFIVRPSNINDISHHESEESLRWQDFGDKIIFNDRSEEYLKMIWDNFIDDYSKSMEKRNSVIDDINKCGWSNWNDNYFYKSYDVPFSMLESLLISCYYIKYRPIDIDADKVKAFNFVTDKDFLKVEYNDETYIIIKNPLNIEDFKFLKI